MGLNILEFKNLANTESLICEIHKKKVKRIP